MPVVQWTCNGGDNQTWQVEPVSDGYWRVIARHTGKCPDVSGASTDDSAEIIQWQCHGGENQQWRVEAVTGGYQLVARNSGKCLDVSGESTDDGDSVIQWSCHGGANQTWFLRPVTTCPGPAAAVAAWLRKVTRLCVPSLQPESRTRGGRLETAAAPCLTDSVRQQPAPARARPNTTPSRTGSDVPCVPPHSCHLRGIQQCSSCHRSIISASGVTLARRPGWSLKVRGNTNLAVPVIGTRCHAQLTDPISPRASRELEMEQLPSHQVIGTRVGHLPTHDMVDLWVAITSGIVKYGFAIDNPRS